MRRSRNQKKPLTINLQIRVPNLSIKISEFEGKEYRAHRENTDKTYLEFKTRLGWMLLA